MKYTVGIDPGVSGGIVVLEHQGSWAKPINIVKMPPTIKDLNEVVKKIHTFYSSMPENSMAFSITWCVEKVNSRPGDGAYPSFIFGYNIGVLHAVLTLNGIPFELVHPKIWQKTFSMTRTKGEERTKWKNRLKAVAQRLFPETDVTLWNCDALLIAEHQRRKDK